MGLLGLFLLLGINTSSWLARLPTVRELLGLSTSELGAVLLVGAVGSLVAVTLAGSIVARFGGRRVLVVAAIASFFALTLEGIGPTVGSTLILAIGLVLNGMSIALMNVPQNVETAAVERRMGRAVLPQFHAAFSIGAVAGSLIGAGASMLDVPIIVQFVTIAAITLVWRLVSIPHVVLDTHLPDAVRWDRADTARSARVRKAEIRAGVVIPEAGSTGARAAMGARKASLGSALSAWREPRTLFIGIVCMAASLSEGSANNWLPIAVVDGFAETEAIGAFVFGAFVTAMTVIRMFGTRLIDRYGRVTTLRLSGVIAIVGLLLFGFAPTLLVAGVGAVLWGMGAALAVPLAIAAASDDPLKAAARVSVVSAFASMSSLAAPPLLGLAAEAIGARHALTLIVVALVASLLLSKHVTKILPEDTVAGKPAASGPGAQESEAAMLDAAVLAADLIDAGAPDAASLDAEMVDAAPASHRSPMQRVDA